MGRAVAIEELVRQVETATQSPPGSLRADTRLLELEGWDSMGMVMLIESVREAAGIELSVHDLRCAETIADLVETLERRLAP